MKLKLLLISFLFSIKGYAQDDEVAQKVEDLKSEIASAENGLKLKLLDSLTYLVEFNEDYNYTPLAQETVALALELDSLRIATKLTADQIYYRTSILNKPQEGLELYSNFQGKEVALEDYNMRTNLHLYAGDSYNALGQYEEAIAQFERAQNFAERSGNKGRIAQSLSRLGYAKGSKGQFAAASQNLKQANTLFTELQDTLNMINSKNSLSILYSQNAFYKEAEKERQEAIALSNKDDGSLYGVYYNASADAREQGKTKEWIRNLERSFQESEKTPYKDFIQPNILNTLVVAHSVDGNLSAAQKYLDIVEAAPEKYTTGNAQDLYMEARKYYAFAKADFPKAITLGNKHLASQKEKQSFVEIYNAENFLAQAYQKSGNTAQANVHKNEYYRIKDSISSAQNVKSLAYYQTLYETEKRDATIAAQESNIALLDERATVRNQWFLIIAIAAGVLFTIFFLRNRYEQKMQKRVAVEQLRTKISADLHDDVGSVLTGLAMQSELIERQVPEENKAQLRKVSALSRDAMLQMRDAVWAMDARKDNWASLIDRIKEFASENLQTKDIAYTVDTSGINPSNELPGAIRQNLYLITKEAIANILKHSTASSVSIAIARTKQHINLSIHDDGVSTDNGLTPSGLGLSNMERRATQLDGKLKVSKDNGFTIEVMIPTT